MNYNRQIMLAAYNAYFIKKYPLIWIWGVHIFLPLAVLFNLLFYVLAYFGISDLDSLTEKSVFSGLSQFIISFIPTILVIITYLVWLVRYNSSNIYPTLPYKRGLLTIGVMLIQFLAITYIPFNTFQGSVARMKYLAKEYVEDNNLKPIADNSMWSYYNKTTDEIASGIHYDNFLGDFEIEEEAYLFWLNSALVFLFIAMTITYTSIGVMGWAFLYNVVFSIISGILLAVSSVFIAGSNDGIFFINTIQYTGLLVSAYLAFGPSGLSQKVSDRFIVLTSFMLISTFYSTFGTSLLDGLEFNGMAVVNALILLTITVVFNYVYRHKYLYPRD